LKATGGASILPQGFSAVDIHFLYGVKVHDFGGLALDGISACEEVDRWALRKEECPGSLSEARQWRADVASLISVLSNKVEEADEYRIRAAWSGLF
jgi:hypothetical protein